MDPEIRSVFLAAALILFVLASFRAVTDRIHLGWLGAAVIALIWLVDALEAT